MAFFNQKSHRRTGRLLLTGGKMKDTFRPLPATIALASFLLLAVMITGCARSHVRLVGGPPGSTVDAPGTLSTAFPILNKGKAKAEKVEATSITLKGALLTKPLPVALGTILPDERVGVFATFSGTLLNPGNTYEMDVERHLCGAQSQAAVCSGAFFADPTCRSWFRQCC